MDDETIQFRNEFLEDFCDSSLRVTNPVAVRRQATRHAASNVDFRVSTAADIERIPENEILRKKHRTKCQHCTSCHCQQNHENYRNSGKSEATLSQHLDHGKNVNFSTKSRRVNASPQQRNQNHRPGTSTSHCQNRNNNPTASEFHRRSKKYENCSRHECSRQDSPLRKIVNSDGATEETDCRRWYEQMHSRNMCKDSELCWQTPTAAEKSRDSCSTINHIVPKLTKELDMETFISSLSPHDNLEPQSETEIDSPPNNRRHEYIDTKKRHSGQGESIDDNNFLDDDRNKPLIETGSSVNKDDCWQQYERDQRELKNLGEDLQKFVKGKLSSGQIDEKKKKRNDARQDTLEKINLFVSKLPVPRGKNSNTRTMSKSREKRTKSPKTRIRPSKINARKTHHSSRIDDRLGEELLEDQQLGRKPDEKLLDIQLESSKLDEENEEEEDEESEEEETDEEIQVKEDEAASETEEEARQLLKEETDYESIKRKLKKSRGEWKRENTRKSRDTESFKRDKKFEKSNSRNRNNKNSHESRDQSRREKKEVNRENMEIPLNAKKHNYYDNTMNRDEDFGNIMESREKLISRKNRTNTRKENDVIDETREKLYERANSVLDETRKNCNGPSISAVCGNVDTEMSKTRTCIDEMINDGLSREAKRENSRILPGMKKDFPYEMDVTERVSLKHSRNIGEEQRSKIIPNECFCHTLTRRREIFPIAERLNDELVTAIKKDDCYCRGIVKILANHSTPRDYVRKLKNRRWYYLDNIQSVLGKLYELETILDSFSPERKTSIVKGERDDDLTRDSRKSLDKRAMSGSIC